MVLAARPGQGKTDFVISLMLRFAAGLRVIYYTMEMTYAQILTRISAQLTGMKQHPYSRPQRLNASRKKRYMQCVQFDKGQ